ncbi:hypothetical protein HY386_01340 [Candidatus Daviesbacteria bacterium]|nr:hypothetical protein [Candidatus Daviesbacteria bacterium]
MCKLLLSALLRISLLFIPILFFSSPVLAQEYLFQEEFNLIRPANTLDPDKWNVYPNNPPGITTIQENLGNLNLNQVNSDKFPFVISKNQIFPEGDFTTEIKFQYTQVTGYGTGIALTDKDPIQNPQAPELIRIDVWQDLFLSNMRLEYYGQIVFTTSINLDTHIFRVERKGTRYFVYLDGDLVFTSGETTNKVQYIWMGNYVQVPAGNWTRFNVDYIRVQALPTKIPLILIPGIAASSNLGVLADRGDSGWTWMYAAEGGWRQFIDSLEKAGYQKDKDYFIAFYDWRKTNDWTDSDPGAALPAKKYLAETIDKAKTANPGINKVNVVAHSLGGLVVRSYIESPNYRNDISKAFLVGSPNAGSLFAYYTWEGAEVPPNWDPVSKAGLSVMIKLLSFNFNEEPYQMIHNRMKGIKDLLPIGYDYLINNGNPFSWTDMQEINNFLKNTSNPQNTANIFAQKGVELFNIIGTGQNTWEKLQIENYTHPYLWEDGKPLGSAATADGDNTVLVSSSNLANTTGLTLADKHANLPNAAASLIFDKLGATYTPSNLAGAPDEVMVAWVASPVTLSVKDSQGNPVGESLIDPTGAMKWVFVENPSGDYKIALTGTGSGDYHVGVDYYTSTKTESVINQGTASLGVNLDYNLNFNPQTPQPLQLRPVDNIPPSTTTQLQGTTGNNGWFLSDVNLSLLAVDNEGGAGLKEIKYSFDNSTWQKYTAPFVINNEGITTVYYRSSDLVGNLEQTKQTEIKIDKTAPEAKISVNSDKNDLEARGIDQNPTTVQRTDNIATKRKDDAFFVITDEAGNTLKIDVRERDKIKQDRFRIYSLQYNNNPVQVLENNHFNVTYQGKKSKINVKEQSFEQKGEIKIRIRYDVKKDKSTIIMKEPKEEKVKEVKDGLVILQLNTNYGNLEATY